MSESISEYEQERQQKLEKLKELCKTLGIDPYGQATVGLTPLDTIKSAYQPEMGHDAGPVFKGAGRVVLIRDMGKLQFWTLRDETGDLQVAMDKKRLPEVDWQIVKLSDLADQVVFEGPLGVTKKGEVTIWATGVRMAAKSLLPPPAKWQGLTDVEARYRQRYVDLWANPEVMRTLKMRMRVVDEIRAFMRGRGYLEVETPMMQTLAGGAAARPFITKHNALDIQLYLRIAPELFLKRLLVGGFTKVFELNRNFRNEGISPRHNPEFTMLEAYEAYGNWETMAELVESMICHLAQTLLGTLKIEHQDAEGNVTRTINLEGDTSKPPGQRWRRVSMAQLVEERTGWRFDRRAISEMDVDVIAGFTDRILRQIREVADRSLLASRRASESAGETLIEEHYACQAQNIVEKQATELMERLQKLSPAEQLVEVYEKLIEPSLIDPTFVTRVPSVAIPLARECKDDPYFADVYELAINGQEISPGYTELNDPEVQARHFAHQVGDEAEKQKTDEDFLTALKYGMPPAGGMGMGIDRLVMMLTGATSIRDVILFPLMRPEA